MARILLIQPPLAPSELYARGSRYSASLIPPLGLAYLAAYLRNHGHTCAIVDGIAEPVPLDLLSRMAHEWDVVGITVVSTYALRAIELIRTLKIQGVRAPVVVGGPHVTVLPESLLEVGADYAVIGEGEQTLLELVEALASNSSKPNHVKGLAYLQDGRLIHTGPRFRLEPLDQVPFPARDLLPMARYRSSIARASRQPSHSMLTSRGCPGTCSFCSKATFGTRIRHFSVDRIVEEFFLLRDRYGARDVAVWDDNFVSNPTIVSAVCDALYRRGFDRTWSIEARVDGMSLPLLRDLKQAGCTYIAYGIESGSQRILDFINKKVTKDQIREIIRLTRTVGIDVRGYFMLGLPTETREEMEETIRFAIELDVALASFTLFTPLPGTVDYKRAQSGGSFDPTYYLKRIVPEFNFPDTPVYVPAGLTADKLMAIHRQAYSRYYFRPVMLYRKIQSIRSWGDLTNLFQGALSLAGNAFLSKVLKEKLPKV